MNRLVGGGRGARGTTFGRMVARRGRAGGGSRSGEARSTSRRGMNSLMAIG
jgi:hypothetical protein